MINKIIKTEEDYNKALTRIDELMDAKLNTPEGDELELLVTLVELYEEKEYPIKEIKRGRAEESYLLSIT